MKTARIIMFLSPLIYLLPQVLPLDQSVAGIMLGSFYSLILRRFPYNLVMAGLCYMYAQQLGREAFLWAGGSFFFPFLAPLVLAFMPAKWNSPAARLHKKGPGRARGAEGAFEDRFPLLERCLSGKPAPLCAEQRVKFNSVEANYEFWMQPNPSDLDRMSTEAATRGFTLWTYTGETGAHLFGAGVVQPTDIEKTAAWLKSGAVPGERLAAVWRQPDGTLKFLEYYP